jgi:hypothetical protein
MTMSGKRAHSIDEERDEDEAHRAAADLAGALRHRDRHAGVHLARLILAEGREEGSAYRTFAHALARQLHGWSRGAVTVREDEMIRLLRAAACDVLDEEQDE